MKTRSKPQLLTKKKSARVERNPPKKIEGTKLSYNVALQTKYKNSVLKLVNQMIEETEKKVLKLFDSETAETFFAAAQDANIASQARIVTNELTKKFQRLFGYKSKKLAESMVKGSIRASSSSLHASLAKLSGGLSLNTGVLTSTMKTIAKAAVAENVALIQSIGSDYTSRVQKLVMRSITTGEGLATLQPGLKKFKGITDRHAKNMALDQTRKVYNTMNKSRMQEIGINEFIWLHSGGDQKPRPQHVARNGQVFSFNDLPIDSDSGEAVYPGLAINCTCTMKPVIALNDRG